MSDYQYCSLCGKQLSGTNPYEGHFCTVTSSGTAGIVAPDYRGGEWGPRDALYDENTRLREQLSSAQRHEDEAVSVAQKQAGRLFLAIVKELAPLFPEDSRELDWDVLPRAVAKVRLDLAAAQQRWEKLKAWLNAPGPYRNMADTRAMMADLERGAEGGTQVNLWLDDVRAPWRHGRLGWTWVRTAAEAIAELETGQVEQVSLDHDLGLCDLCLNVTDKRGIATIKDELIRNDGCASYCSCKHNGTGYDVVCWMEEHDIWPRCKPIVHSMNPVGRARMKAVLDRHYWAEGGTHE